MQANSFLITAVSYKSISEVLESFPAWGIAIQGEIVISSKNEGQLQANVAFCMKNHEMDYSDNGGAETIDRLFAHTHKSAGEKDALKKLSRLVAEGKAAITLQDGRCFSPASMDDGTTKVVPEANSPIHVLTIELSGGRISVAIEDYTGPYTILLSHECKSLARHLIKKMPDIQWKIDPTVDGKYQLVAEKGALAKLIQFFADEVKNRKSEELFPE